MENKDKKFMLYMVIGIVGLIALIFLGVTLLVKKPANEDETTQSGLFDDYVRVDKIETYESAIIKNGQVYYYLSSVTIDDSLVGEKIGRTVNASKIISDQVYNKVEDSAIGFDTGIDIYSVNGYDDCIAVDEDFEFGMFVFSTNPEKYTDMFLFENIDDTYTARIINGDMQGFSSKADIGILKKFSETKKKIEDGEEYLLCVAKDGFKYNYELVVSENGSYLYDYSLDKIYFAEEKVYENN